MKILLIKLAKGFYGGEKQTLEWIEGLKDLGHEITLLTLPASELNKKVSGVNKYEFNLFPYPDTRLKSLEFILLLPYHWYRGFFMLKKIKQRHNSQVVCIQEPYEKIVFTPLARLMEIKVIWLDILYWKPFLVKNFILMFWLRWTAHFVDLIIASSEYIYQEMTELFPKNKITIIRHVLKREETDKLKNILETKYPIRTIGFIGSLSKVKGVITLLEAFKIVAETNPSLKLIYAGQGTYEKVLARRIKEYHLESKVKLLGKVPKIDFFNQTDLVVVPSHFENVPYVLHESMFAKRIVVASKTGGIPELFPGKNKQWLAQPNNAVDLAVKIKEVLTLDQAEIRAIIKENYLTIDSLTDYRRMILEVEKSFKEVLGQL